MMSQTTEPWHKWRKEMPSCTDSVNYPEYQLLNSNHHLRKILTEVRTKLFNTLQNKLPQIKNAAVLLAGGTNESFQFYDGDILQCTFRQEPYFRYLFGVNEPNMYGILDLNTNEIILLISPMPLSSQRWFGKRKTFNHYKTEYLFDDVLNIKDIESILINRNINHLYLLYGQNTDSKLWTKTTASFKNMNRKFTLNYHSLHPLLMECRVCKTKSEIQLIRIACLVTSKAHVYVMRHIKANMTERQLEALFKGYSYYFGGARHQAKECICGSGNNGSILHYGHSGYPNSKALNNGECVVLDMGSEYNGYATDITTSYPVNGKFTKKQRLVHNAVYDAYKTVLNTMKAGILWTDMHRLAERIIVKHLWKNMNILKYPMDLNGKTEEMIIDYFIKCNVGAVFMPHGLGHFMGLNHHDVGGYNDEYKRSDELGLCWLRTSRKLMAGMVITVEPGMYFNQIWIEQMMNDLPQFEECIDKNVLKGYMGSGGCRLEDNVLVTKDGIENFTFCPRTCDQIEKVMRYARNCKL
eukprot:158241_1